MRLGLVDQFHKPALKLFFIKPVPFSNWFIGTGLKLKPVLIKTVLGLVFRFLLFFNATLNRFSKQNRFANETGLPALIEIENLRSSYLNETRTLYKV